MQVALLRNLRARTYCMIARSDLHLGAHLQHRRAFWLRWTVATAAGELLGFAIPALAGAAAAWLALGQVAMSFVLVLAGVGEGVVLGLAQWLALRWQAPSVGRRAWVTATALGAAVAWALAMLLVTLREFAVLDTLTLAVLAVPCGLIFLCSIGGAQWWILRRYVAHAGWWILVNAIAWPLGVAIPVVGMALLPDRAGPISMLAVGIASGVCMGALVGAITGAAMARLLSAGARG
jgi:hypothetical protein